MSPFRDSSIPLCGTTGERSDLLASQAGRSERLRAFPSLFLTSLRDTHLPSAEVLFCDDILKDIIAIGAMILDVEEY